MPRVFGLNLIAVLVSGVAFWLIGYVFYGVVFMDAWREAWGFVEADLEAMESGAAIGMVIGFLISIFTAFMIGFALKFFKADAMMDALKMAGFLWVGFALPTMAYDIVYAGQPIILLMIDGAHLLVGYLAIAAIQRAFK